jgi:hypothetical protein
MVQRSSRVQKKSRRVLKSGLLSVSPREKLTREGHLTELLIRTLNNSRGLNPKVRPEVVDGLALMDLVERFQHLHEALDDKGFAMSVPSKWGTGGRETNPELTRRFAAVNQLLKRYQAVPVVHPDYFFTAPVDFEPRGWQLEWSRPDGVEHPYLELRLVREVVRIAQTDRISSIKQCEQCGRWMIARFSHQRFCPKSSCREDFHRVNEFDKERRRDWAREHYKIRTTKNVK